MKIEVAGPAISSTLQQLTNKLGDHTALAIGERHGVEEHPRAAGCLLASISKRANYTLVLEHLDPAQQVVLDQYRLDHPEVVDGLGTALKWWTSGWPAWSIYKPLFETAWLGRAPILAGDVARTASIPSIEDSKSLQKAVGIDVAAE